MRSPDHKVAIGQSAASLGSIVRGQVFDEFKRFIVAIQCAFRVVGLRQHFTHSIVGQRQGQTA